MKKGPLKTLAYAAAAVAALLASGPMLPIEIAIWFSGELLLYLEVVSGVWLTSRATIWPSLRNWLRDTVAQSRHYIGEWPRSHPALASWLQWTFASI